jgi:hypothetical protein
MALPSAPNAFFEMLTHNLETAEDTPKRGCNLKKVANETFLGLLFWLFG